MNLRINSFLNNTSIQTQIQKYIPNVENMNIHEISNKFKKIMDEKKSNAFIDKNTTAQNEILDKNQKNLKKEIIHEKKYEERTKVIQEEIEKQRESFLENLKKKKKFSQNLKNLEKNWSFQVINNFSNIRLNFSILTTKFIDVQISKKTLESEIEIIQIPVKNKNENIESIKIYTEAPENQNKFLLSNNLKNQKMLIEINNLIETYVLFTNTIFYKDYFLKSLQTIIKTYNEKYHNYVYIYEDYFEQIKEANNYVMGLENDQESVLEIVNYLKEEELHELTKKEDEYNKLIKEEIFDFHNLGFIKTKNISILYMQDKIFLEFLKIINQNIKP